MRIALILAVPAIICAQQPANDIIGYRDIAWGSAIEAFNTVVPIKYDGREYSTKAKSGTESLTIVPRFGYKGLDRVVVRVDGLYSMSVHDEALQNMESALSEKYGSATFSGRGGSTWKTKTTTIKLTSYDGGGMYLVTVTYLPSASSEASTSQAL